MAESVGCQSWPKSTQSLASNVNNNNNDNARKSPTQPPESHYHKKVTRENSTSNNNNAKTMPSTSIIKNKSKKEDVTTAAKNIAKRASTSPTSPKTKSTPTSTLSSSSKTTPSKSNTNAIHQENHVNLSAINAIAKSSDHNEEEELREKQQVQVKANGLDNSNSNLKKDFEILTKDANESRQKTRRLQSEIEEKNEIILLLRDELEVMREQNDKLERDSRQLSLEVKKYQALQDEYDELKNRQLEESKLESELSRLKEKLLELEFANTRIKELEDFLGEARKDCQQFEKELDDANEKLTQNSTDLTNLERELNKIQTKSLNLESERNSFEDKLLESLDREARLQANNKQAEEEIKRLQILVKSYEEKRDEDEANNSLIMSVADLAQLDSNNQYNQHNVSMNQSSLQCEINSDDKQQQQAAKHDLCDTSIKFELDKQLKKELNEENENLKKHISEQECEIKNLTELNEKQKTQIESNKELISTLRRDLTCEKTLANKLDKRLAQMSRQIKSFDDNASHDLNRKGDTEIQDESSRLNITVRSSSISDASKNQQVISGTCKTDDNETAKQESFQRTSSTDIINVNRSVLSNRGSTECRKPNLIVHVKTQSPSNNVLAIDTSIKLDSEERMNKQKNENETAMNSNHPLNPVINEHNNLKNHQASIDRSLETNNAILNDQTKKDTQIEDIDRQSSSSSRNLPTSVPKFLTNGKPVGSSAASICKADTARQYTYNKASNSADNHTEAINDRQTNLDETKSAHPTLNGLGVDSTSLNVNTADKAYVSESRSNCTSVLDRNNIKISLKNNKSTDNNNSATTTTTILTTKDQLQRQQADQNDNFGPSSKQSYNQTSDSPTSNTRSQSSSPSTTITIGHDSGFQSINQG